MVRFHWGETGSYTYTPVDGIEEDEEHGIVNIKCEMEVSVWRRSAREREQVFFIPVQL